MKEPAVARDVHSYIDNIRSSIARITRTKDHLPIDDDDCRFEIRTLSIALLRSHVFDFVFAASRQPSLSTSDLQKLVLVDRFCTYLSMDVLFFKAYCSMSECASLVPAIQTPEEVTTSLNNFNTKLADCFCVLEQVLVNNEDPIAARLSY
jgi:hypothetical protein